MIDASVVWGGDTDCILPVAAVSVGRTKGERHIAFWAMFCDESGTHKESPLLTVGGYLSTLDNWKAFWPEWKSTLDDYELEFFHMNKFVNGAPHYEWEWDKKEACFARLSGIVNRFALANIVYTLDKSEYDSVDKPTGFQRDLGGPYGLALSLLTAEALAAVRTADPDGWVAMVFEAGAQGRGQIARAFDTLTKNPLFMGTARLGGLMFQDKREFLPLQAADMVAYEVFREESRPLAIAQRAARTWYLDPLASISHRWKRMPKAEIQEYANAWGKPLPPGLIDRLRG